MSLSRIVRAFRPVSGWWNAPLPNFLIAGASRSGTASLWNYLRQHPDIFMPDQKELGFFDDDRFFERGVDAYRRRFLGWNGEAAVGEATPRYFTSGVLQDSNGDHCYRPDNDSAARVAELIPDVKSIISLRDPVYRAFSQYRKRRAKGTEHAPTFRQAIEEELDGQRCPQSSPRCLVFASQYFRHLERWFSRFPRARVKVVVFEEWTTDPRTTYRALCDFLNISRDFVPSDFPVSNSAEVVASRYRSISNGRRVVPQLDEKTYQEVWKILQPDVLKLEEIVQDSVSNSWGVFSESEMAG